MFRTRHQRNFTIGLMIIYLIFLIWIVLLKCQINFTDFGHVRRINLIPYNMPMITNGRVNYNEVVYNVLVFIPFGIFTAMFRPDWKMIKKIVPSFVMSLLFEVTQFIFAIGTSDITDVIGNTFGGLIGVLLFTLLFMAFKKKTITIINVLGSIVSIVAVGLTGTILVFNAF